MFQTGLWRVLAVVAVGVGSMCAPVPVSAQTTALYFDPPLQLPQGELSAGAGRSRVFGDLDGDGRLDIVVVGTDDDYWNAPPTRVSWFRGLPGGHFDLPRVLMTCHCNIDAPKLIDTVDDAGVELLLAITSDDGAQMRIVDVRANGSYVYRDLKSTYGVPYVVDVNLDGRDDVVVAMQSSDTWWIKTYVSQGNGTFQSIAQAPQSGLSLFSTSWGEEAVDQDADGLPDLMLGLCPDSNWGCTFRGDVDRRFMMEFDPPRDAEETPLSPGSTVFRDIDQDGLPDALVPGWEGTMNIAQQLERNHFYFTAQFQPINEARSVGMPTAADVDNDGLMDIVYSHGPVLVVQRQVAPGQFVAMSKPAVGSGTWTDVVDLDRDGCLDVVIGFQLYRGRNCGERQDVSVKVEMEEDAVVVRATHRRGSRPRDETLRVLITPAGDGALLRLAAAVGVPDGCHEVSAPRPRRLFDCTLPTLLPGETVALRFPLKRREAWQKFSTVAFRLGGEADSDAANDRDVKSGLFVSSHTIAPGAGQPSRTLTPAPADAADSPPDGPARSPAAAVRATGDRR